MKKNLVRLVIIGAGVLVVLVVAVFLSLGSIVKKGFETVGPRLTRVETKLGGANLSPFSGGGSLNEMFIGNPEGYRTSSAIKVGRVEMHVSVGSLLSDTIVVDSIAVESPEITMEGSLNGSNLTKLLDNIEAAAGGGTHGSGGDAPASKKKFKVKDFVIKGARVNLSLNVLAGKQVSVVLPELHLQNIGTESAGVTAAELSRQIMKPLMVSVTKAATEGVANVGKQVTDIGKGAVKQLDGTTRGVTDLFKKAKK